MDTLKPDETLVMLHDAVTFVSQANYEAMAQALIRKNAQIYPVTIKHLQTKSAKPRKTSTLMKSSYVNYAEKIFLTPISFVQTFFAILIATRCGPPLLVPSLSNPKFL